MLKTQAKVRAWHQAMGDDFPRPGEQPVDVTRNAKLRLDLLLEELQELGDALGYRINLIRNDDQAYWVETPRVPDTVGAIDALADLEYVLVGAADTWGIDLEPYFDEVHRSNMTKVGGPVREDGKRLKPDTYEAPNLVLVGAGRSLVS